MAGTEGGLVSGLLPPPFSTGTVNTSKFGVLENYIEISLKSPLTENNREMMSKYRMDRSVLCSNSVLIFKNCAISVLSVQTANFVIRL